MAGWFALSLCLYIRHDCVYYLPLNKGNVQLFWGCTKFLTYFNIYVKKC